MDAQIVLCPNKKCGHRFATEKEESQCGNCGLRFISISNVLDVGKSQNLVIREQHENQIKKIESILEKLSSKHKETGIAIKEIREITKKEVKQ